MELFYFLCGNFEKRNFIYAIKSNDSDWHYFEEADSLIEVHVSLPMNIGSQINKMTKITSIALTLNADQIDKYVNNGKFIFKGKELETCKSFSINLMSFNTFSSNFYSSLLSYENSRQTKQTIRSTV